MAWVDSIAEIVGAPYPVEAAYLAFAATGLSTH